MTGFPGHDYRCSGASPEVIVRDCREKIERYGWTCMSIFAHEESGTPDFSYTVGLTKTFQHPELVIAGLTQHAAHSVLITAVSFIERGTVFTNGAEVEGVVVGYRVRFRSVNLGRCAAVSFGVSNVYYGRRVPRLQLLWPDVDGAFPGDPDSDAAIAMLQMIED